MSDVPGMRPSAEAEVDSLLETFDQTDTALQRRIVAALVVENARLKGQRDRLGIALKHAFECPDFDTVYWRSCAGCQETNAALDEYDPPTCEANP